MRILFAGKQHYDPGGIPASTDQLAIELTRAGHTIAVLAHRAFDGPPAPPAERRTLTREPGFPYEAYSVDQLTPGTALAMVVRSFDPDVVVVNAGGWWWHDWTRPLLDAAPCDLPLVLYVRDAGALDLLDEHASRVDLVLANAQQHANAAAARGVTAAVIPSVVDLERYRVEPTGDAVVFINPVAIKGVETAFAIAEARPEVPFHFRESWHLPTSVADEVQARATRLGNVELLRSTTVETEPYARARVLLVPYADGCRPRVVAEAQVSGIPVLARDDPALRETVGPGGILVPPDAPLGVWLDGLDQLWGDPEVHRRYARAARLHSLRPEIDPRRLTAQLVELLEAHSTRGARPGTVRSPAWRAHSVDAPPVASVVVPVRNVADTIDDQLAALARQTYREPWEVIVADNGSTDSTRDRVDAWQDRLPCSRIVDASARRGVAHARNVGIAAARGDLVLICDGDDIVAPDWLEHMCAALDDAPIVTGFIDIVSLNRDEQHAWSGDAARDSVPVGYGHLPYAPGGNIGMWREVFDAVGPFDEALLRAEDIDFGWRAHAVGITVAMEPRAVLHRRLRSSPWAELRAAVRSGIAEVELYRRHAATGMPAATTVEAIDQYRWLVRTLPDVVRGRADRFRWSHHAGKRVGRLLGSARERTRFL